MEGRGGPGGGGGAGSGLWRSVMEAEGRNLVVEVERGLWRRETMWWIADLGAEQTYNMSKSK